MSIGNLNSIASLVRQGGAEAAEAVSVQDLQRAVGRNLDPQETAALRDLQSVFERANPAVAREIARMLQPPEQGGLPRADAPLTVGQRAKRVLVGGVGGAVTGAGVGAAGLLGAPVTVPVGALVGGIVGIGAGLHFSGPED